MIHGQAMFCPDNSEHKVLLHFVPARITGLPPLQRRTGRVASLRANFGYTLDLINEMITRVVDKNFLELGATLRSRLPSRID